MSGFRYAVYFAPEPASALARFGAGWLGYDVATGATVPQPTMVGVDPGRLQAITAEPRRYGFHATLKPPFVLAEGSDIASLEAAVGTLASGLAAFETPPFRLARIGGFWALMPSESCPVLGRLAEICVTQARRFPRPSTRLGEVARRRRARLDSGATGRAAGALGLPLRDARISLSHLDADDATR